MLFVWEVVEDLEFSPTPGSLVVRVMADDRSFIVYYHLEQDPETRHLTVVKGRCGRYEVAGSWRRFSSPRWETDDGVMGPGAVRRMLDWCRADGDRVEVNYLGVPLRLNGS